MATKQSANYSTSTKQTKVSVGQPGNTAVAGHQRSKAPASTPPAKGAALKGFSGSGVLKAKV